VSKIDHAKRNELGILQRELRQVNTYSGSGGDGDHPGTGTRSIQLGDSGDASGQDSVAVGPFALATDDFATALGPFNEATNQNSIALGIDSQTSGIRAMAAGLNCIASGPHSLAVGRNAIASNDDSIAIGDLAESGHIRSVALGAGAETTANDQIMLGTASQTVVVPGTFSNPSARRLKRDIIPAPYLVSVFPALFEWEYIAGDGRRQIGPMADDLVGTDAERFLVVDDEGEPAGIDKLGLHTAQIAVLLARIERLEEELRRRDG
jgi:autotransporter adhesin